MLHETVYRFKDRTDIYLRTYILDEVDWGVNNHARPAILICPGGGYAVCSNREAEPIGFKFSALGYQVFILQYSIVPDCEFPRSLTDASWAICHIRKNAEKYRVDPDKIAIWGASAGGHLAASLAVFHSSQYAPPEYGVSNRPDAVLLSYPVITTGEFIHQGSIDNITPNDRSPERLELLSLEKHVSQDTPPTFLWHTVDDSCVSVENSFLFAAALRRHNVPFELHIFESGFHGLADCSKLTCDKDYPHTAKWLELATSWLNIRFSL